MPELPRWSLEMCSVSDGDESLPSGIDGINLVLNRHRLATFLASFGEDQDVRDLLTLDVLGVLAGLPLSSTGLTEDAPNLAIRPFRLWEYAWLYKVLGLASGRLKVLDLGGPASHLTLLAAIAGCDVISIDINPAFVQAAQQCAEELKLGTFDARAGDMRDLSMFEDDSFDVVLSCSVLEHLAAEGQITALREVARVLKPGGMVGLTFDFGLGAPGANIHLPPPHDPPPTFDEAIRRYLQGGLTLIGNPFEENPIPGSLFHHETIQYTIASLFLTKPPSPRVVRPECRNGGSRLAALRIPEFPYRLYQHFTRVAANANRTENDLKQAFLEIKNAQERTTALQQIVAEGLAAIQDRESEIEIRGGRIAQLETTAAEHITTITGKDQHIAGLNSELEGLQAELQNAAAAIDKERGQVARLQRDLADLEERFIRLTSERDSLARDHNKLTQQLRRLEQESLREYLARWYHRDRS